MQWSQIKTIFIISFLILNLFLVQQLIEKINQTNFDTLDQTTFEDQLKVEDIKYNQLPESGQKEAYVSAQRYQLTDEDLTYLEENFNNQKIKVINNEVIVSQFKEPLDINLEDEFDQSISKVQENVLKGGSYSFWDYYEEENVLLYFQKQSKHTFYFNESGVLIVVLNDEGNAIQYRQTMLADFAKQSEEQTVIDPLSGAIDVLYDNNVLKPKDEITNMSIGYHTLVPLEDGVQVFVPTWEVTVNEEKTYFVNAMESQYIPNDEKSFVMELRESLKREIDEINRSETE